MILNKELDYNVLYDRAIKYRDLYNNSPDLHISVSASTANIVECNLTASKKLEYTKEELIGKPIFSIIHKKSLPVAMNLFKNFKTTGRVENVEINMLSKSGKIIYLLLNTEAIRDKDGNILYSNSCLRDISKIKLLEKELEISNHLLEKRVIQRTKELENKNKELEQFAYITSHDLKEPLSTIIGFSELLLTEENRNTLNKNQLTYLEYILETSTRMSNVISNILEYTKLNEIKKLESIDCNTTIKNLIIDLNSKIKLNNVKINYSNLPVIKGVEVAIKLIFQNLISNSLKFKKDNTPIIIDISYYEHLNHHQFCVSDNGIGIANDLQKGIFTIYKKNHINDAIDGSGIGLAHCKKIVNLHEGKIWVESELGKGAKFYFTIKKF